MQSAACLPSYDCGRFVRYLCATYNAGNDVQKGAFLVSQLIALLIMISMDVALNVQEATPESASGTPHWTPDGITG